MKRSNARVIGTAAALRAAASRSPVARRTLGAAIGLLSLRTIAIAVLVGFVAGAGCGGCVGVTSTILFMRSTEPPAAEATPVTDPAPQTEQPREGR